MPHHIQLALTVNGEPTEVAFAPYKTLLEVLREDLNLCGTKHGCELGECGACAVLLDGQPVLSCLVLGAECEGRDVLTVEGLATDGRLHPLQETFADLGAAQCGYCTPGFLITAKALLDEIPDPSRDQIREALAGCLCRCTGYQQIFEAVEAAVLRSPERLALQPVSVLQPTSESARLSDSRSASLSDSRTASLSDSRSARLSDSRSASLTDSRSASLSGERERR
jgi:carbon-monoxide dehydrogenase small subunit